MERALRSFFRLKEETTIQVGRILLAAIVLGFWEIGSYTFMDPFFFSSPSRVARHLLTEIINFGFYRDLYVTALETAMGYFTGALSGVLSGILLARLRIVARIFDPFLMAANSIPRIALAPLMIMWFGIDMPSKVVLAGTLVFFLTFFNTFSGMRSVDQAFCNVALIMGASNRQIFLKVMLPAASSWILTGLKMSLPFALIGVIIGEFMAASVGLGYRLNMYTASYNTTGAIAMILVMMCIMMILTAFMNKAESVILRWRPPSGAAYGEEPMELR
jgi:NitT/TauT family transport system permease protein